MKETVTVIGLLGSPRRRGNTEQLLDKFLEGASDAGGVCEKVILSSVEYSSCKGCNACHKSGICIMDDAARELFDRMLAADCIVISSPIYTMGVTTEVKSFIDRAHYLWVRHFVLGTHVISPEEKRLRRGYFLSTAGMDQEDVFDTAFPMLRALFNILDLPTVSSPCPEYGRIWWYYRHPTALSDAYRLGHEAVFGIRDGIPCQERVKR
jgi:putative NADPH-quinone reductase